MEWIRLETKYVTGTSKTLGGSGDPSPVTGYGVYVGMKACAHEVYGSDSLKGKTIAVQGAGNVASHLCTHLAKDGADLIVTDIYEKKAKALAKRVKATYVKPEKVFDVKADIFAPCALGGVLNDDTIPKLKVKIVAGGANNQLLDEKKHMQMLIDRHIHYAPDYAINAGGLMNVYSELEGYNQDKALKQAEGIYDILKAVFALSKSERIPTSDAANRLAEERIKKITKIKQIYSSKSQFTGRLGEMNPHGR
jgi:leucine dehydrogenase